MLWWCHLPTYPSIHHHLQWEALFGEYQVVVCTHQILVNILGTSCPLSLSLPNASVLFTRPAYPSPHTIPTTPLSLFSLFLTHSLFVDAQIIKCKKKRKATSKWIESSYSSLMSAMKQINLILRPRSCIIIKSNSNKEEEGVGGCPKSLAWR